MFQGGGWGGGELVVLDTARESCSGCSIWPKSWRNPGALSLLGWAWWAWQEGDEAKTTPGEQGPPSPFPNVPGPPPLSSL